MQVFSHCQVFWYPKQVTNVLFSIFFETLTNFVLVFFFFFSFFFLFLFEVCIKTSKFGLRRAWFCSPSMRSSNPIRGSIVWFKYFFVLFCFCLFVVVLFLVFVFCFLFLFLFVCFCLLFVCFSIYTVFDTLNVIHEYLAQPPKTTLFIYWFLCTRMIYKLESKWPP